VPIDMPSICYMAATMPPQSGALTLRVADVTLERPNQSFQYAVLNAHKY